MKSVITILAALATLTTASLAHADGFECRTESGMNLKVYNNTQAQLGTRTAAIMIVSNENVNYGNKTIATFEQVDGLLSSYRQTYVAKVDLRYSGSNRAGEYIGGTRLGELAYVYLSVDYNYSQPAANGAYLKGWMTLQKRTGEGLAEQAVCRRYLKN